MYLLYIKLLIIYLIQCASPCSGVRVAVLLATRAPNAPYCPIAFQIYGGRYGTSEPHVEVTLVFFIFIYRLVVGS